MFSNLKDAFVVSLCLIFTQRVSSATKSSAYEKVADDQCIQGSQLATNVVWHAGECSLACSQRNDCGAYQIDRTLRQCTLLCLDGFCDSDVETEAICTPQSGSSYQKIVCTDPQVAYSTNNADYAVTEYDQSITCTCDTGYEFPDGEISKETKCRGSQWSPALPDCQLMTCTVQSVALSTNNAGGSTVNYGDTVTHTCNNGYISGSDTSVQTTCNENNQWSSNIQDCVPAPCTSLQSASSSENLIVQRGGSQGDWGKDNGKIYWLEGYSSTSSVIEFPSESNFISNVNGVTRNLPVACNGCNNLFYGGKFYCDEAGTKNVVVIDMATLNIDARISFANVGGYERGNNNQCHYGWGGYSDIDIEADEDGLWVIWGKHADACNIGLSKINPTTNTIEQTWWVPVGKSGKGNAFMRCGMLYIIASYSGNPSYIQYKYDTATSSLTTHSSNEWPWYNHHGYNSHAHYDQNEEVVYVWDGGHQYKTVLT